MMVLLEAELPPADQDDTDPSEQSDEQTPELPAQDEAPAAPVTPPADPVEPAGARECMFTDSILKALMFDYTKIPAKALVIFDMSNPEQIHNMVQKITTNKTDITAFDVKTTDGKPATMLHRHKQMLAQLMLKALKYDSKQLTVNSSLATDKVTPETAKQIQKELSVLLGI